MTFDVHSNLNHCMINKLLLICFFPNLQYTAIRDQPKSSEIFIAFNEATPEVHLIFCCQFLALRKLF